MSFEGSMEYAGDLLSRDAYESIIRGEASALIDVRTEAEWAYVGTPDLRNAGKTPVLVEWQVYPSMQTNPRFVDRLTEILTDHATPRDAKLLFICRSGARSRLAAIAMSQAGWLHCYNVSDGFEGALDSSGHRGVVGGWKAAGLPWTQT